MEFGRKRVVVDDKLLKQEVLKKNKKLQSDNSNLSKSIGDKKKELKEVQSQIKNAEKFKKSITDEINQSESIISSLKDSIAVLSDEKLEADIYLRKATEEVNNS